MLEGADDRAQELNEVRSRGRAGVADEEPRRGRGEVVLLLEALADVLGGLDVEAAVGPAEEEGSKRCDFWDDRDVDKEAEDKHGKVEERVNDLTVVHDTPGEVIANE